MKDKSTYMSYRYICIHIYDTNMHIYVYMYVYINESKFVYVRICNHMYVCICIYMYINICTKGTIFVGKQQTAANLTLCNFLIFMFAFGLLTSTVVLNFHLI
jgi:hypothetical protein